MKRVESRFWIPASVISFHVLFNQSKTFSVFAQPDINTRGVGRVIDSYD